MLHRITAMPEPLIYILKNTATIIETHGEREYITVLENNKHIKVREYALITQIIQEIENNILWITDAEPCKKKDSRYMAEIRELRMLCGHTQQKIQNRQEKNKIHLQSPALILKLYIDILLNYITYRPKRIVDLLIYLSKRIDANIFQVLETQFNGRKDFIIDVYLIKIRILKEENINIENIKCICEDESIHNITDRLNTVSIRDVHPLKDNSTSSSTPSFYSSNSTEIYLSSFNFYNTFSSILENGGKCISCYFNYHHSKFIEYIKEIENDDNMFFIVEKISTYLKYFKNIDILEYYINIAERSFEKKFICVKSIYRILEGIESGENDRLVENMDGSCSICVNSMANKESYDNNSDGNNITVPNHPNPTCINGNNQSDGQGINNNNKFNEMVNSMMLSFLNDSNISISHCAFSSIKNYKSVPGIIYNYYLNCNYNKSMLFYKILKEYRNKYNLYTLVNIIKIVDKEVYVQILENIEDIIEIFLKETKNIKTNDINFNMLELQGNHSSTGVNDIDNCRPFVTLENSLDYNTDSTNDSLESNSVENSTNDSIDSNTDSNETPSRINTFEEIKFICGNKRIYDEYKIYKSRDIILLVFKAFILRCSIMDDSVRIILCRKIDSIYKYFTVDNNDIKEDRINNFITKMFNNLSVDMKDWRYKKELLSISRKYLSMEQLNILVDKLKNDKVFYIRELVKQCYRK